MRFISAQGLVGISIEFESHGITQFYKPFFSSSKTASVFSYDSSTYPISVVRKEISNHPHVYNKPLTVEGSYMVLCVEAESIYLKARSIKPNACLNCCAPFMDKDAFTAILDVQNHLECVLRGLELSKAVVTFSILLLSKYYARHPIISRGSIETDPEIYLLARRFVKYACAAYGSVGIAYSNRKKKEGKLLDIIKADREVIVKYLNIDPAHLLIIELMQQSIYQPAYLVFYDPETKSIVLSIRGSLSLFDAVTDFNCDYIPWKEGLLHGGFYTCARWMIDRVLKEKIPNFMSIFNTTRLNICGHSMGAGVASIIGLLLNEDDSILLSLSKKIDLKVYCYGTPAVISEQLVERSQSHNNIFSFNYGNDLVSHLSFGSVRDFCTLIMVASKHITQSFFYYLKEDSPAFDAAMAELRETDAIIKGEKASNQLPPDATCNLKLISPGFYYQMYRVDTPPDLSVSSSFIDMARDLQRDKNFKYTVLERTDGRDYCHMLVTPSSIAHHIPIRYEIGFDRCFHTMAQIHGGDATKSTATNKG